jgi:hypothetical protein
MENFVIYDLLITIYYFFRVILRLRSGRRLRSSAVYSQFEKTKPIYGKVKSAQSLI